MHFVTKTPVLMLPGRAEKHDAGKQIFRAMKLTAILLLAAVLQVSAKGKAQTVTYSARSTSLEKIFSVIKEQTGFALFYSKEDIKGRKKIDVSLKDADIRTALLAVLEGQPLTFSIEGNTVFISPKEVVKPTVTDQLKEAPPIKGVVRSADGQPLAGVNVVVKGTNKGTTTSANGSFEIDAKEGDKLVISSIGYTSKEINVTASQLITVSLAVSNSPLDEVQIIAYGETSKRLQTGNVSSVKAKDIEQQPVQNPLLALQGRVPGVTIDQSTGMPGSGIKIRIQGQNSLNNGNDPLYVIDGIPFYQQLLPALSSVLGNSGVGVDPNNKGAMAGNPLGFINPLDILSIEVLKDADATAIYGSRGANGVVLITTKKGKPGPMKIDFNIQKGWGKVPIKMDLLNTPEYLEMRKEGYVNDSIPVPDNTTLPDYTNYDLTVWDQTRYTDWQDVLIGGSAQYDNVRASVSGGSAQTNYLLAGTFHRETTVFPGDFSNKKGSVNFNINSSSSNNRLKLNASALYQLDNSEIPNVDLTDAAIKLPPNAPALYNSDGSLNWEQYNGLSTWLNPLATLLTSYNNRTTNLILRTSVSYEVVKDLNFKIDFGYGTLQSNEVKKMPITSYSPETRAFSVSASDMQNGVSTYYQVEPQINYRAKIWDGVLDMMVGSSVFSSTRKSTALSGNGFSSDLLLSNPSLATYQFILSPNSTQYKYNAVFTNIRYNLADKYILNLNARRDGSSRFGPQNRFHNFGSIGAAWILSNEEFIKNAIPALSFAKLRASFGTTGNDQIGEYQFMSLYTSAAQFPYQGIGTIAPNRLNNYFLQWEETSKLALGIDLGAFNDRLLLDVGYFQNQSSNQLLNYTLPVMTGFGGIIQNFPATILNRGWEFSLNTSNIESKNFAWRSNLNLTVPENKVSKFPNIEKTTYASGGGGVVVGMPLGISKIFDFVGVDAATGLYLFKTADNKTSSEPDAAVDRLLTLNTSFPKWYGGISNTVRYKSFQFDFLFQLANSTGTYYNGNNPGFFFSPEYLVAFGNQPKTVLDRWQKPGDIAGQQRFTATLPSDFSRAYEAYVTSDALYQAIFYARLKNASVSYDLPKRWMNSAKIQSMRLFVQGQNLFTITNYKGLNPEMPARALSLPPLRVIVFGLQASF